MKAFVCAFALFLPFLLLGVAACCAPDREHTHPPALPLGDDNSLKSYMGSCDKDGVCEGVELVSSYKKTDKYEYTYVFKNVGKKKTWLAGSSVIDRAIGFGDNINHYYRLKPGEATTVTVVDKDPPKEYMGVMRCFNKDRHDGIEDFYKENGVKIEGVQPTYFFQMGASANAWIPEGRMPKKEDK